MGKYSPAKTEEYPRIFRNFLNRWIINTIASIWLRKDARIFVLGHFLFLEAHSFPRASVSENSSLLGTDNVRGQISEHIFAPSEGYCLYIHCFANGEKNGASFRESFLEEIVAINEAAVPENTTEATKFGL